MIWIDGNLLFSKTSSYEPQVLSRNFFNSLAYWLLAIVRCLALIAAFDISLIDELA